MVPHDVLVRFRRDLDALVPRGTRIGIAVSGGPDSLALLLLAAAARPGEIEAATVDHDLRAGSREEAQAVSDVCERLGVPHAILTIKWDAKPATAIQERARSARYVALADWMRDRALTALLTGHHLDDQAETFFMRLNRGSGVTGLAGMRPVARVPGASSLVLARPLLGWRRRELVALCEQAGQRAVDDPSNADTDFERVRVRQALADCDLLDAESIAHSASNLMLADDALNWATLREWTEAVEEREGNVTYSPIDAPAEIRRRIVTRIIAQLGSEGDARLRGRELERLMVSLQAGDTATLRGVRCEGGSVWRFAAAKPRKLAK